MAKTMTTANDDDDGWILWTRDGRADAAVRDLGGLVSALGEPSAGDHRSTLRRCKAVEYLRFLLTTVGG